jgi:MoaA/NifB/PqqE/SkfB family radical SAM enzyme
MSEYLELKELKNFPRFPVHGTFDITYRCSNNCRHCWLRIPSRSQEKQKELSLDEIKGIVDEARKMGCRSWNIFGGEPMVRSDFVEIFDYITRNSVLYSLNTNGALITPEIARLMRRKGKKLVALYGATAEVHDHITRNPGSFDATMRGFAYLKEADAGFIVQVVPMRDNYHQYNDMVRLAESLSPRWRIGAAWLYLSACGDPERNREIIRQRLDPKDVIELDGPQMSSEEDTETDSHTYHHIKGDDRLFEACISNRPEFHIDPYGQMTFCAFIKDPDLRYDLRKGSFRECWDEFIPSLADKVRGGKEYLENCGSCELRKECRWCPVYGYLEHRRFSARVDYLCDVARESAKFREQWKKKHRRYYEIASITIRVDSDLPITDNTFRSKFELFQVDRPGDDVITIRHHFSLPDLDGRDLGKEIYRQPPWIIYRKGNSWLYLGISPREEDKRIHRIAVFNKDYTRAQIYSPNDERYRKGDLNSLTSFPSDQILVAQLLADREGCYIHSGGVILDGKGLLFAGHSDAGKSTMVTLLKDEVEILCDDRNIVRKWPEGYKVHGTWSHGDVPDVSPSSAPLKAILFLEQARDNLIIPLEDRGEIMRKLYAFLVKPLVTIEWWDKMFTFMEKMVREVDFYIVQFDKSGRVVDLLKRL